MAAFGLPDSIPKWQAAVAREGLTGISIHGRTLDSASKFQLPEFLLLRIIYAKYSAKQLNAVKFGLEEWVKLAETKLNNFDDWTEYLHSFGDDLPKGRFFLARLFQGDTMTVKSEEVDDEVRFSPIVTRSKKSTTPNIPADSPLKSRSKETEPSLLPIGDLSLESRESSPEESISPSPRTPRWAEPPEACPSTACLDENTVNTALGNLLRAITYPFRDNVDFSLHRVPLKAVFSNPEHSTELWGTRILIEVKAPFRANKESQIRMQESAQMVAWLKQYPNTPSSGLRYRRIHIAQDKHEIFLIFAEFDPEYVEYLDGKTDPHSGDKKSFMTLHEVGPFSTTKRSDMNELGKIILALFLRAQDDRKEEQGRSGQQGQAKPQKAKKAGKGETDGYVAYYYYQETVTAPITTTRDPIGLVP
ncbi:hypothetical protein BJX61DRAFT_538326 [Aspergillus egyptiacus]|nr:hypothetical protein BJX61DRAFT_538326 [Aspergillus egyptiacus]